MKVLWILVALVLLAGPAVAGRCAVLAGRLVLCDDREEALIRKEGPSHGSLFDRDGRRLGWFRIQGGTLELFDEKSQRIGTVPGARR